MVKRSKKLWRVLLQSGSNENPLIIGGAMWNPDAFKMKGMVDELRIFKRALSAKEIQKLYQQNEVD